VHDFDTFYEIYNQVGVLCGHEDCREVKEGEINDENSKYAWIVGVQGDKDKGTEENGGKAVHFI
jgi:hypothetical protein